VLPAEGWFLRAGALTRWSSYITERAFFFEFRHEQAKTICKSEDAENPEQVSERDIAVTRFEVLIALNGDSGTACKLGLSPVAPEALGAKTGKKRSHNDTLSRTRQGVSFACFHNFYFTRK
jgi:hypothetical protein